uniref:Cytochrome P450 n=1 Tax=Rhabditophanes sp. KR3021 TaxID=114890 RepID=A0AC35U2X8_9BILA
MFVLLSVLFLTLFLFYECYWKRKDYPKGPTPLPLIGNLHTIAKYQPGYDAFLMWKKQFGPIYTFWEGTEPVIAFCDFESVNEAFVKQSEKFSNRAIYPDFSKAMRNGYLGIFYARDDMWQSQRRFSLKVLRDLGVGKSVMEEKVINETVRLIEKIKKDAETGEVNIIQHTSICVASVINEILFGFNFEGEKEKEFLKLKKISDELQNLIQSPVNLFILPHYKYLKHLPYFNQECKKLIECQQVLFDFVRKDIKDHINHYDSNNEPTDFVTAFLNEMHKEDNQNDPNSDFNEEQLTVLVNDIFVAGLETTITTILYGIIYMLHNSETQEKIHEELDRVIGSSRIITTADKNNLIYTQAVVNEMNR